MSRWCWGPCEQATGTWLCLHRTHLAQWHGSNVPFLAFKARTHTCTFSSQEKQGRHPKGQNPGHIWCILIYYILLLKKMSTNISNYESFTANLGLFRTNLSRLIHKVIVETLTAKWQWAPNTEDQSVLQIRSENKCLNFLTHRIKERVALSF